MKNRQSRRILLQAMESRARRFGCKFIKECLTGPSTTFTPYVFSSVHRKNKILACGVHSGYRPTDSDKGTHLPLFGQFYIVASNLNNSGDLTARSDLVALATDIIKESFEVLGIKKDLFSLVFRETKWKAVSTGYQGQSKEIFTYFKKYEDYDIGEFEICQYNIFDMSGGKLGRPIHLLVFGIDRIVYCANIVKSGEKNADKIFEDQENFYEIGQKTIQTHMCFPSIMERRLSDFTRVTMDAISEMRCLNNADSEMAIMNIKDLNRYSAGVEVLYAKSAINFDLRLNLLHQLRKNYQATAHAIINDELPLYRVLDQEVTTGGSVIRNPGMLTSETIGIRTDSYINQFANTTLRKNYQPFDGKLDHFIYELSKDEDIEQANSASYKSRNSISARIRERQVRFVISIDASKNLFQLKNIADSAFMLGASGKKYRENYCIVIKKIFDQTWSAEERKKIEDIIDMSLIEEVMMTHRSNPWARGAVMEEVLRLWRYEGVLHQKTDIPEETIIELALLATKSNTVRISNGKCVDIFGRIIKEKEVGIACLIYNIIRISEIFKTEFKPNGSKDYFFVRQKLKILQKMIEKLEISEYVESITKEVLELVIRPSSDQYHHTYQYIQRRLNRKDEIKEVHADVSASI